MNRPFFAKRDLFWAALVFAAVTVVFCLLTRQGGSPSVAEVRVGDRVVAELRLTEAGVFTDPALPDMVIETEKGRVRVRSSGCPDQVCVHTGWISRPGEAAVCLPNRVSVTVRAENQDRWIAG